MARDTSRAVTRSGGRGAGSPQAQRIQIARQMELEAKMAMARRLAGIAEGSPA